MHAIPLTPELTMIHGAHAIHTYVTFRCESFNRLIRLYNLHTNRHVKFSFLEHLIEMGAGRRNEVYLFCLSIMYTGMQGADVHSQYVQVHRGLLEHGAISI